MKPGVSTADLDKIARDVIQGAGAVPTFWGIWDIPPRSAPDQRGSGPRDTQSQADFERGRRHRDRRGATLDGFVGDTAATFPVGKIGADRSDL